MWVERHGKAWRIRDLVAGRKVTIGSGYGTKTAAKAAMTTAAADKLRGDALIPRGGRLTLNDWIDAWQPSWEAGLKASTALSEPARIRNHIRPLLGRLALDDVEPLVVQQWVATLLHGIGGRRPLAPKTVRNCHGLLHKILQAAVVAKLVRANACAQTSLPERVYREMRFLTEPEFARLYAATPAHWRPLVLLLVSTGLRWGEAIGLRVKNVDLLARPPRLTVLEAMHELAGTAEVVFTSPKTARSRRTVTFTAVAADALAGRVVITERESTVFTAPMGGYVRTRNFRRGWVKWCKAAGLAGLRIHDLRHTHASWLISANVPLTAISRRLGHSSIAVTSDLYGHLLPEVDEGILAAVEAALAGVDRGTVLAEVAAEI